MICILLGFFFCDTMCSRCFVVMVNLLFFSRFDDASLFIHIFLSGFNRYV